MAEHTRKDRLDNAVYDTAHSTARVVRLAAAAALGAAANTAAAAAAALAGISDACAETPRRGA